MQGRPLGLILAVVGVCLLIYGVIGVEHQTANIDIGGIKATATEHHSTPWATVLGIVALVAGAAVIVSSSKRPPAA